MHRSAPGNDPDKHTLIDALRRMKYGLTAGGLAMLIVLVLNLLK
jgi:hypothetical protein